MFFLLLLFFLLISAVLRVFKYSHLHYFPLLWQGFVLLHPATTLCFFQSTKLLVDILYLKDGKKSRTLIFFYSLCGWFLKHVWDVPLFLWGTRLVINHVPESLQVSAGGDLLPSAQLAVVHQTAELLEALLHQQPRLADCCTHTISHWTDKSEIDTDLNSFVQRIWSCFPN